MRSPAQTTSTHERIRAQSETLGFVLVIGFVLLGAALVVGLGAVAIGDTEDRLSEDSAEQALTQLDSKAALVALGESDSHAASFGSGAGDRDSIGIEEDNGWMHITVTNRSTGTVVLDRNITLGALIYEGSDARLGYQGGGVWRADRSGGQMVSPPEFHYRGATLTLPVITVTGDGHLNEDVTIRREGIEQVFPDPNTNDDELRNPLDNHVVNITVGSEFYRGWAEYFEERTDGQVEINDDKETARLSLVSPIGEITVSGAVAGQESSGMLRVQGNPHHPCGGKLSIDGYDSSNSGDYCDQFTNGTTTSGGNLVFAGDILTQSAATGIRANLVSGGSMDLAGQMDYYGNFSYTDECRVSGGGPSGDCDEVNTAPEEGYTVEQIDGIEVERPIDFAVVQTVDQSSDNAPEIDLGEGAGETDTLTEGQYYTTAIDLNNEDVTFDTSGGDIVLAVEDTVTLKNDASIVVEGDGEVELYVKGDPGTDLCLHDSDLCLHDSEIYTRNSDGNRDNNATKMTVLGTEDFVGEVIDEAEYTGIIYAPAGDGGDGEVVIDRQGTVYGAVVTGDMILGQPSAGVGGTVHFDKQLEDKQVIPPDKQIIPLTFLHITKNDISITG